MARKKVSIELSSNKRTGMVTIIIHGSAADVLATKRELLSQLTVQVVYLSDFLENCYFKYPFRCEVICNWKRWFNVKKDNCSIDDEDCYSQEGSE